MKTDVAKDVGPEEIVALFGEARLVRVGERLELRGGSMADRAEALEWLAAALPEQVLRVTKSRR